jgi:hypothetical protein
VSHLVTLPGVDGSTVRKQFFHVKSFESGEFNDALESVTSQCDDEPAQRAEVGPLFAQVAIGSLTMPGYTYRIVFNRQEESKIMVIQALRTLSISLSSLVLAVAFSTITALAGTSGGIGGKITDANTGKPVAGAVVVVLAASEELTTTTDAKGYFRFFELPPDRYSITVEKGGYVTQSWSGYDVEADQTQLYDFQVTPEMPNNR